MENLDINEVLKIKEANIIDVRETFEFSNGSIKGAKNIPMMGLILNDEDFLDKDEKYYIMCQSGGRSMQVCMELKDKGYDVVNLTGGYVAYNK